MKNLLLIAALAAASLTVNAQDDVVNMVVNGNFENPNYVQSVPGDYSWEPVNEWESLSYLPGWNVAKTGGVWNGVIGLVTGEWNAGDGDLRPEDDENTLLFRGYNDNGWTSINASQVVKNLVGGREYTLDFLIAQNQGEGSSSTPEPDYGVAVSEVDVNAEGEQVAGRQLLEAKNMAEGQDLTYVSYKFTAPANGEVFVNFVLGNYYYQGNRKDDLWMEIDLVRIYSAEGDETAPESSVAEIFDNNAPVEYYNLQGVRVNNAENGIFIRKQGNKTSKVIL